MKTKVIKIDAERLFGEASKDFAKAIAKAISEGAGGIVIEDGQRPSETHEYKMSMVTYAKHRRALHETVSLMISEDETADDIMALIFSIGFKEGYKLKEDELKKDSEKEEPEKDDD